MKSLIIGGTGTLGQELTRQLLQEVDNEVVILSRCELKQRQMYEAFNRDVRIKFVLGDIRDKTTLTRAIFGRGFDVIFHVAALKHVDVLEENPEESVATNVLGTINVADVAIEAQVPHVVFSSTDKAVDPINAYGMSKGLSEKILYRRNEIQTSTKFCVFRWGNVIGSRGSAIHFFAKTLKETNTVFLTDSRMTRFWIKIEEAVRFMLDNYKTAPLAAAAIPEMRSAPIYTLACAVAQHVGAKDMNIVNIGFRRGEKMHEQIISAHSEQPLSSEVGRWLDVDQMKQLVAEVLG